MANRWFDGIDLPINAFHLLPLLAHRPLFETALVDIVPTSSLAPHDLFCFRLELRKAYRAVAANLLSVVARRGVCFGNRYWSVGEDETEFLALRSVHG